MIFIVYITSQRKLNPNTIYTIRVVETPPSDTESDPHVLKKCLLSPAFFTEKTTKCNDPDVIRTRNLLIWTLESDALSLRHEINEYDKLFQNEIRLVRLTCLFVVCFHLRYLEQRTISTSNSMVSISNQYLSLFLLHSISTWSPQQKRTPKVYTYMSSKLSCLFWSFWVRVSCEGISVPK